MKKYQLFTNDELSILHAALTGIYLKDKITPLIARRLQDEIVKQIVSNNEITRGMEAHE